MLGLIYLLFIDPSQEHPLSFCPLKLLGIGSCPGCGLGQSVAFMLHGDVDRGLEAHWLGPFALLVITHRIVALTRNLFTNYQKGKP